MQDIQTTGGLYTEEDRKTVVSNICEVFDCAKEDIEELVPVQAGLTNIVLSFRLNGGKYVYRHPGLGSEILVERGRETIMQKIVEDAGIDTTLIAMDVDEGWRIEWYENQMDFSDFYTQAMDKSPLFKKLEEQDYDLDLYDTGLIYNNENVYKFQNIYRTKNKFTSRKDYLKAQLQFVGFKYAPYFLKKYFTVSGNVYLPLQMMVTEKGEKFTRRTASDCKSRIFNWTDGCAYNQIQKDEVTFTDNNVFHYIHLEGSHLPFTFNKDMVYDSTKSYTYYDKVAASLTIITSCCDKLKEAGIYDNTAIVVLADHGYNRIHDDAKAFGRQNPLLMIKGFSEDHEMNTSGVQISYDDLQQIYSRLLDGAKSDEVVDYQEGEVRTRRFLHLRYLGEDHLTEYETQSDAADTDAMYETGRVYDYSK